MKVARAFPWADYRTFVDVGTAQGDLAAQIALASWKERCADTFFPPGASARFCLGSAAWRSLAEEGD